MHSTRSKGYSMWMRAMSDPPKLVVTREQAKTFGVGVGGLGASRVVLRLPERPTMRCPVSLRLRGGGIGGQMMTECPTCGAVMPSTAGPHPRGVNVSIPEGTRVEVGWWSDERNTGRITTWHPVATATLAEVVHAEPDGPYQYRVTLTDVEACHA